MALAKITQVIGRAVVIPGDDIDTDRIIPARFLKCITFDGLGEFAFYDERKNVDGTDKPHPLNEPEHAGASIMIGGFNFGCGSSREHAPQSLHRAGFKAVIAGSFAEIFFGNSTTIGLPCVCAGKEDLEEITNWAQDNPDKEVSVDLQNMTVSCGGKVYKVSMPESAREGLLTGRWDAIADLLEGAAAVESTVGRLPYVR
ncbi:MAG: 3-isopropylmalate dehydratase small subunit [Puniceicoccales bacterium]|jgi:3-isopropylmalate/(R)-2-methylmalate dehydratase small subunit|nr:3-isopropylmalate dehydratase small subunit [Puniceicoccales bacterium]